MSKPNKYLAPLICSMILYFLTSTWPPRGLLAAIHGYEATHHRGLPCQVTRASVVDILKFQESSGSKNWLDVEIRRQSIGIRWICNVAHCQSNNGSPWFSPLALRFEIFLSAFGGWNVFLKFLPSQFKVDNLNWLQRISIWPLSSSFASKKWKRIA